VKVLLSGANGLRGRRLAVALRRSGRDVVTHGRGEGSDIRGDLREPEDARRALDQAAADVVIHLVSLTNVDQCEREPDEAYRLNVRPVENLVDAMKGMRSRPRLVMTSTDQVYDGPGLHTEDDVVLRNTYALTKFWAERVGAEVGASVLRTNFFGRSRTPGRTSLTDWIIAQASAGREMTLFTDVFFSPLSIETLCAAIDRVLATSRQEGGVFNLGSREGMSKADFARAVAEHLGLSLAAARDGTQADVALAARRPLGMLMDVSRFERAFHFPLPTLHDEIRTAEL
jgi:dTDP-4-dehydrorhamnose reductase